MYVSGGIDDKARNVSNDVYIIVQLRSNQIMKKQTHACCLMLLTRPDKVQIGLVWQAQILFFFVYQFSHIGVREIFFQTGRKSTNADLIRFIPVHNVVSKLYDEKNTHSPDCVSSHGL